MIDLYSTISIEIKLLLCIIIGTILGITLLFIILRSFYKKKYRLQYEKLWAQTSSTLSRDYHMRILNSFKDREQKLKNREQRFRERRERWLNDCQSKKSSLKLLQQMIKESEHKITQKEEDWELEKSAIKQRFAEFEKIMQDSSPFIHSASLIADMKSFLYDEIIHYLQTKPHPAFTASEIVKDLKTKTKPIIIEERKLRYRLETLLDIFPELRNYIDNEDDNENDSALLSLSEYGTISEFQDNHDRVSDYLSQEEYERLDEIERNQLALNRYHSRPKSSWQIGIEYELWISYLLREKRGFFVVNPFGSIMGVHDLGRDIIASTIVNGQTVTYIIQCKNWSRKQNKEIHENVVCQTFGTAIEYELSHPEAGKVIPKIIATVDLSDMASKFASKLGVEFEKIEAGIPPLIKCNVSPNGKIYHLPFDQQYYRTEIKNYGEFYAFTVKEAYERGFRRAKRFLGEIQK